MLTIAGKVECEHPNKDLHSFSGQVVIDQKYFTMTDKQLLLKGADLANTEWVISVCIYTGVETKIMLNSQGGRVKMSHLESMINKLVLTILFAQSIVCSLMAIGGQAWQTRDNVFDDIITEPYYRPSVNSFLNFFTYFILLNTLLPISL